MRRRRADDRNRESITITTSDGTRLRCSLAWIGREAEPRWMLLEADGTQHVGPTAIGDKAPESVQRVVDEWWSARAPTRQRQ